MQVEEFQNILNDIQSSTFENKVLTVLLNMFKEQDDIKRVLAEHQNRLNDLITEVNALIEKGENKE